MSDKFTIFAGFLHALGHRFDHRIPILKTVYIVVGFKIIQIQVHDGKFILGKQVMGNLLFNLVISRKVRQGIGIHGPFHLNGNGCLQQVFYCDDANVGSVVRDNDSIIESVPWANQDQE